ncbi:MAG: hypothetical protein ACK5MT_11780 [Actinomycetales bacterium]
MYVSAATLLFTFSSRGIWSTRGQISPASADEHLTRALLGSMAYVGALLVGSWVEHTYSTAAALPILVIAVAGAVWMAISGERHVRRDATQISTVEGHDQT